MYVIIIILHYNSAETCWIGSEHLYAMCTESTSSVHLKIVSKHLKKLLKRYCVFTSRNTIIAILLSFCLSVFT